MQNVLARSPFLTIAFIVLTLLYAVMLPPFEIHDEAPHFARAAQLAFWDFPSAHDGSQTGMMLPRPLAELIRDWQPDGPNQDVTKRPLPHIWHDLAASADTTDRAFAGFSYLDIYPPVSYPLVLYAPQAIGLRLGWFAGLPPLGQFYAGRLAGGVTAIALVLLGIALMPYGGRAMLVIAALPGISSIFISYSFDSAIIYIAFLTIAILLRGLAVPGTRAGWALPVLVPLLALGKGVYLPIAAAGMGDRAAWRPRRLAWTLLWMAVGVALFAVWFDAGGGGGGSSAGGLHYTSRRTLQHMIAAVPHDQFWFMVAHPGTAAWAVIGTIIERLPVYVVDCIGRFGAFNVLLPLPLYVLGAAVVAGGTLATRPDEPLPTLWQRGLWLAIVAVVVILVHIAVYMTATALGEDYVEGVQGRYLIPALPLLALALRFRSGAVLGRIVDAALPWAAALLMAGGLATAATAYWRW